jgi:hypothetical protein
MSSKESTRNLDDCSVALPKLFLKNKIEACTLISLDARTDFEISEGGNQEILKEEIYRLARNIV